MAQVRPFRAIVYDTGKVDIREVVAPPYDVINEKLQGELYDRSPYNVVRVILGRVYPDDDEANNRYTRARLFLQEWLSKGILKRLENELFFVYQQRFTYSGTGYVRSALLGRVRLEDYGGSIIPHEKTLSSPKEDRLRLFRATKMNLSPVFGIALDDGGFSSAISGVDKTELFRFEDSEGVLHILYAVDRSFNESLEELLEDKKILIADGHHRYETALNYMKEMRKKNPHHTGEEPYNFVMMAIVSSKDPGLLVLPIHRVLKNLGVPDAAGLLRRTYGCLEEVDNSGILRVTDTLKRFGRRHFCWFTPSGGCVFRIEDESEDMDVVVLHREVLHGTLGMTEEDIRDKVKIEYFKNIQDALEFLGRSGDVLFSYIPPSVEEIAEYSLSGKVMPQKSTYFYPKFYSGLAFYSLED